MPPDANGIIRLLDLQPHPEGGHYRETWRADAAPGERAAGTANLFPAKGRRSQSLAPGRFCGDLALVRRRALELSVYETSRAKQVSLLDQILRQANAHSISSRQMPGSPPRAPVNGRWRDARCPQAFEFKHFELAVGRLEPEGNT